jgi:hypothetical protein
MRGEMFGNQAAQCGLILDEEQVRSTEKLQSANMLTQAKLTIFELMPIQRSKQFGGPCRLAVTTNNGRHQEARSHYGPPNPLDHESV